MTDNASRLRQAIDQVDQLVAAAPPGSFGDPTPCEDYDVATLIDHLATIAGRVTAAATASPPDATSEGGPQARWHAAHESVLSAINGADPARRVELPFGRMPLAAAFATYTGEFTTHAWDLAVAIRRADLLDDALAEIAVELVTARIPASPREPTPFGNVVPVPVEAPAYDRLAGWMGRDPSRW
jgi:uncharacterized protein (TIGR03086 family)